MAGGADFAPTDTEMGLLQTLETELTGGLADYKKLMEEDLPAFNHTLSENNVAAIVAVGDKSSSMKDDN